MQYFFDTEFLEGPQEFTTLTGNDVVTKPTIDLISIGITSLDGQEYQALSKDFDLKLAWENEWIHDNVLSLIFAQYRDEVFAQEIADLTPAPEKPVRDEDEEQHNAHVAEKMIESSPAETPVEETDAAPEMAGAVNEDVAEEEPEAEIIPFTIENMERIIQAKGKSLGEIAAEIYKFINPHWKEGDSEFVPNNPEFYAYYSAYDWVVFCWIFGRMIDLPDGFPMFCRDLKVMLDDKLKAANWYYDTFGQMKALKGTVAEKVKEIKTHKGYPKQSNEHLALDDAQWNKALYSFILGLRVK